MEDRVPVALGCLSTHIWVWGHHSHRLHDCQSVSDVHHETTLLWVPFWGCDMERVWTSSQSVLWQCGSESLGLS